jgi:hypothetical protein
MLIEEPPSGAGMGVVVDVGSSAVAPVFEAQQPQSAPEDRLTAGLMTVIGVWPIRRRVTFWTGTGTPGWLSRLLVC